LMAAGFVFVIVLFAMTARPLNPAEIARIKVQESARQQEEAFGQIMKVAPAAETDLIFETKDGRNLAFKVELARTDEEIKRGLMERTSLAEDAGMLFLFEDIAPRAFWMRNTFIPLDIIFMDADGIITHIHHDAVPQDITPLPSEGAVAHVLEIGGGLAKKLNITEGDKISNPAITAMKK
jgi:uncharacterized protein